MTRSWAVRVPSERGESVRQALREQNLLRTDLRLHREGASLLLPIVGSSDVAAALGELLEADFVEFDTRATPRSYHELVACDPETRRRLPRSFDVIGDVVLIRLPPELDALAPSVGDALLRFVPHARIVGRDQGVHGPERVRSLTRIAGHGDWRTVHHENGVAVEVDVERAYFSPRLAREHADVASAVGPGEVVYDLCCGVGPFALTIARAGQAKRVVAVDRNPAAIALLRASLRHARGALLVEPVEADISVFLAGAGPVDRAILNLPHEGIKYLASVARLVRPGGTVHYYEVVAREALPRRTEELVYQLGGASEWTAEPLRNVHPYSPTSDLMAFTFTAVRGGGSA